MFLGILVHLLSFVPKVHFFLKDIFLTYHVFQKLIQMFFSHLDYHGGVRVSLWKESENKGFEFSHVCGQDTKTRLLILALHACMHACTCMYNNTCVVRSVHSDTINMSFNSKMGLNYIYGSYF